MVQAAADTSVEAGLPLRSGLRWRIFGLCLLIFFCGVLLGALGGGQLHWWLMGPPRLPGTPGEMTERIMEHLSTELSLEASQVPEVRKIIAGQVSRIESIRTETSGKMDAVMNDVGQALSEVLSPQQQEKWRALRPHGGPPWHRGPFGGPGRHSVGNPPSAPTASPPPAP